jgi:NADH-quinone oxidoreductase subunit I
MKKYFQNIVTGSISLIKGMRVTFKNIFVPKITLQYPKQKQPMVERYRGLVDFRAEKCISCLQCVKICPTACINLVSKLTEDKKKVVESFKYQMELCCFCGLCEQVCPVSAVYLNKIYEVAVFSRDDLKIDLLDPQKYAKFNSSAIK